MQAPASWHSSVAAQVTPRQWSTPAHTPAVQTSPVVLGLPSPQTASAQNPLGHSAALLHGSPCAFSSENTYAEPVLPFLRYAPARAVFPDTLTDEPRLSFAAPSPARSFACWIQLVPLRAKTYAAPLELALPFAPMRAVSPHKRTDEPRVSFAAPSPARSSACWAQLVPLRAKTYAAPVEPALPH